MTEMSACPKCGNGFFKVVTKQPQGSEFGINFVQCASCNSPIGVIDSCNIGKLLKDQAEMIKEISSRLENIEGKVTDILSHHEAR